MCVCVCVDLSVSVCVGGEQSNLEKLGNEFYFVLVYLKKFKSKLFVFYKSKMNHAVCKGIS